MAGTNKHYEILYKLIEAEHSKAQKWKIVDYVLEGQDRFDALIECFFCGEYRICQRAAWPLGELGEPRPEWFVKHLPKIIKNLGQKGNHDSINRNTLRLFQFVDIPERLEGRLLDKCLFFLMNPEAPIAVRALGMTIAAKISRPHPELLTELKMIIREQLEHPQPPGIKGRAKKILAIKQD